MSDNPTTPSADEPVRGTDTTQAPETPAKARPARRTAAARDKASQQEPASHEPSSQEPSSQEASSPAASSPAASSPEPWSPATDANVRSADDEAPRERVARARPKDRHANERPAKDATKDATKDTAKAPTKAAKAPKERGGDAPLRRRPAAAVPAPADPASLDPASVDAAPADLAPVDSAPIDLAPAAMSPVDSAPVETHADADFDDAPETVAVEAAPKAETAAKAEPAAPETYEGERIAKAIARAGIASRRDVEAMIAEGRITLNGRVLDTPAINVTDADAITVDGEPLPTRERTRLWIFHKPRGLVTTARDPEGRQTVFEVMPEEMPRVVAIGRLDINTEGLLLLTNDGGLAKVIAHPDTGWLRRYRVRAFGDITQMELDQLRKGVTIDGMEYGPVEATLDRATGDNVWLTLGLREGKNREVKRILEHLGLSVNRLIRLSFGPFQLGDLEVGLTEEIKTKVLKEQLGKGLSAQAGVDFESPVREPIAPFGAPKKEAQAERPRRDEAPRGRAPSGGARPMRPATPARVPTGGMGAGPRRSVWRADESDNPEGFRPSKVPRRGADPKAERAAAAESRGRERVGAINTGDRRVLVERLSASPAPAEEAAPQRRYARDENGAKPQRRRDDRDAGARPDRPYTPRFNEGADRGPPRSDRGTGFRGQDANERPREARGYQGERRDGGRTEGARPEGRGYQGKKPAGQPRSFEGNSGGFGGKPSGGFGGKPGGERETGYKGRVEGSFKPRSEGGFKGGQGRPGGGAGRPAGGKPGGFGGKPGGFGGKPSGGFGGRPGGGRPPGRGGR
ncbi:pseudouridine synthase [Methylobacterium sp. WL12]|uniref:pseudouridine synthase n=1 Tax=Methylobacterium sp. WL12 TaxID=2603890 RepID=UPI001FEF5C8A|nr:pseudouridine synthase [Methylobacterium sp. WL12]